MPKSKNKQFSVAVCGAVSGANDFKVMKRAYDLGRELAANGFLVRTGGCGGYPSAAANGAYDFGGEVVAVSPAKNIKEHISFYKYETDNITEIEFTGMGIPLRNHPLVYDSDAIIIVGGQHGTMIEFGFALHYEKPIGILLQSGGIVKIAKQIADICKKKEKKQKIIYDKDPKKLVAKLKRLI